MKLGGDTYTPCMLYKGINQQNARNYQSNHKSVAKARHMEVCRPHAVASPPTAANHESSRVHRVSTTAGPIRLHLLRWRRAGRELENPPFASFTWRTAMTTPPRQTPNTQGRICGTSMRWEKTTTGHWPDAGRAGDEETGLQGTGWKRLSFNIYNNIKLFFIKKWYCTISLEIKYWLLSNFFKTYYSFMYFPMVIEDWFIQNFQSSVFFMYSYHIPVFFLFPRCWILAFQRGL
jgi:hypothetical protein